MIRGVWFRRARCGLLECEGSEWSHPHCVYLQICERTMAKCKLHQQMTRHFWQKEWENIFALGVFCLVLNMTWLLFSCFDHDVFLCDLDNNVFLLCYSILQRLCSIYQDIFLNSLYRPTLHGLSCWHGLPCLAWLRLPPSRPGSWSVRAASGVIPIACISKYVNERTMAKYIFSGSRYKI